MIYNFLKQSDKKDCKQTHGYLRIKLLREAP